MTRRSQPCRIWALAADQDPAAARSSTPLLTSRINGHHRALRISPLSPSLPRISFNSQPSPITVVQHAAERRRQAAWAPGQGQRCRFMHESGGSRQYLETNPMLEARLVAALVSRLLSRPKCIRPAPGYAMRPIRALHPPLPLEGGPFLVMARPARGLDLGLGPHQAGPPLEGG